VSAAALAVPFQWWRLLGCKPATQQHRGTVKTLPAWYEAGGAGERAADAADLPLAAAAKVFFRRNGTADWIEISFILRFLPALAMSKKVFSLDDVNKGKKGGDGLVPAGASKEQTCRHELNCLRSILLACADPKQVTDQELRTLMLTEFGRSIGPYMRAVFPPQVTSVLQHAAPVPPQYRLELTEEEKQAAIDAPDVPSPAPPHDFRDFVVRRGGELVSQPQQLSLIFLIPNFTGLSGLGNQPHWFKSSGPYFGDPFTAAAGDAPGAARDRDILFWTNEWLKQMESSFAPVKVPRTDHNPSYHQPQNEY
jgi:hypothetical protein